jgi:TolB-like protein
MYRYLATLDFPDKIKQEMQSRHFENNRKHWRAEIQTSYQGQKTDFRPKPNSIAVLYFRNISNWPELQPVTKGFTELINHDFGQVNLLEVSPRGIVQSLYDVSKLTSEQIYDKIKATEIGRILNVSYLVTGGIERISDAHIKISAGVVNAKTGHLIGSGALAEGQLSDIIKLEKEIVTELIHDLSILLSGREQKAVTTRPTNESLAFIAFSKGLDSEDRGDFDTAKNYYKKALEEDKSFRLAKERYRIQPGSRYSDSELVHIFSTELN